MKCLYYYGQIFSFKVTKTIGTNVRIYGKFKITNKTKVIAKNIPYSSIFISETFCIVDYSITLNQKKTLPFYLYICENQDLLPQNLPKSDLIKNINNNAVSYYKKLFNTKIISKNKEVQFCFNTTLPKEILQSGKPVNYQSILKCKDLPEQQILQEYKLGKISAIDFYLLLKCFVFGISESKTKFKVNPKTTNLVGIKFKKLQIVIENNQLQNPYLKIDNVKYYKMNTISKSLKLNNSQITLVI